MKLPNITQKAIRDGLKSRRWDFRHHDQSTEVRSVDLLCGAVYVTERRHNISPRFAKENGIDRHAGFDVTWYVGDPTERRRHRRCSTIKEVAACVNEARRWYESVADDPPFDVGVIIDDLKKEYGQ